MILIGLSGNPGAGKTTVSNMLFNQYAVKTIHLDRIFDGIKNNIGGLATKETRPDGSETIYLSHNSFYNYLKSSPVIYKAYKNLWGILGRRIVKHELNKAYKEGYEFAIVEGISLFDFLKPEELDYYVFVKADYEVREERVINRNTSLENRINNPMNASIQPYYCDYIIENNGSFEDLESSVKRAEEFYSELRYYRGAGRY